ncbi:hypothetical protein BC349_15080 [Flavihumibacter stibioxidans]|uniref:DUF4384 domain-containing protein n=2 Tax=Flavihumibacter stibioxidans TaxID=1834163 RepID=A0ABR7MCW4_9BACT|nr:hypothetical protein [Flavihumibacter stibioxidans]
MHNLCIIFAGMARIICKRFRFLPVLFFLFSTGTYGQDTLPSFSAQLRPGNKVLVSWNNHFGKKIRQISIQRSADSLRNYKTIMTLPDPTIPQNGYLDQKVIDTNHYYRLYILLDSGKYIFSPSKKATRPKPAPPATVVKTEKKPSEPVQNKHTTPIPPAPVAEKNKPAGETVVPAPIPERFILIERRDTVIGRISEKQIQRFRDSVSLKTKDTLVMLHPDTLEIRPFIPADVFRPSRFVFMDKSGLLHIELPDATRKKYMVRFFESDRTPLFDIKEIRDELLLLDKANFLHAGWYLFELYEEGKLKEKNRFFIARDF